MTTTDKLAAALRLYLNVHQVMDQATAIRAAAKAAREAIALYDSQRQQAEAGALKCNVCGGSKTVEQFTSAAAPVQRVKCFACNGTGVRQFNCFADNNPEAEWIEAEQKEAAVPAPVEQAEPADLLTLAVECGVIRMSQVMNADLQDALVRFAKRLAAPAQPAAGGVPGGFALVPESALRWLFGEEGRFECPPDRYFRGSPPPFWWRGVFRDLMAAPQAGSGEKS